MTLDETADFISEGLEPWQRQANLDWLEQIHRTLKVGGVWAYPDRLMIFTKTVKGFELVLDEEPVLVEQ